MAKEDQWLIKSLAGRVTELIRKYLEYLQSYTEKVRVCVDEALDTIGTISRVD